MIYTLAWGFQRCSVQLQGQCESLNTWDWAQNWLHVFRVYAIPETTNGREGAIGIEIIDMKRFILSGKLLTSTALLVLMVTGCSKKLNSDGLEHFDEDGAYLEKIQSFTSARPANIKFYVEVSGSMNGFFRSNKPTNFKTDVWSVFSDFASSSHGINIFFQQNANPRTIGLEEFRNKMNAGAFVSGASTDVPDMLDRILNDVDCKKSEVGILVSDMKYDPVGNTALQVLLQQYSIDIRNKMSNTGKALCLIVAMSDFLDKSGNVVCEDSPYYYLVIGKPENVVWIRNFVCTLLKHHGHYVDAVEWGIDYKSPKVKISDPDYLNVENRSCLGGFDEDATIALDIDITDYPWIYENADTLIKYLKVKSEIGMELKKLSKKDIIYDITEDDGSQLKRAAIAKVKLCLSDMYGDADVLSITINTPEILLPNTKFLQFLGATDPNDVSKTFSMEEFLSGCYSSMPRFREKKPVHILISKN